MSADVEILYRTKTSRDRGGPKPDTVDDFYGKKYRCVPPPDANIGQLKWYVPKTR